MDAKHRNGSDPLVVPTTQLAAIVNRWIARYEAERRWGDRPEPFAKHGDGVEMMTAQGWIDYHAAVSHRALWRIIYCETRYTSFGMADDLLTAIGEEFRLTNGELDVIRNPMWSQEGFDRYMAIELDGEEYRYAH